MKFRSSFCDPFQPEIIERGEIPVDKIIQSYKDTPWSDYLARMEKANEADIYFSPSLEIENAENKNGLSISVVGSPINFEFYIFFKRPKNRKILFGLFSRVDENYLTDIKGQTDKDVLDCLHALVKNDLQFLENKIR